MLTATRERKSGILLILCAFLLPVGVRYHALFPSEPGPHDYMFWIDFWIPTILQVSPSAWKFHFPVSMLGILLPAFAFAHGWLAMQGFNMVRGRGRFNSVRNAVLVVTLLSVIGFFPTLNAIDGGFPLPITLIVGILLARWGIPPLAEDPFDGLKPSWGE